MLIESTSNVKLPVKRQICATKYKFNEDVQNRHLRRQFIKFKFASDVQNSWDNQISKRNYREFMKYYYLLKWAIGCGSVLIYEK